MLASREALLILGAIGYYAFDVASMGAAFEALGGGGPALGLFVLAYTIGHAGAIIPLPGSAEGGLVGAFTLFGSALSLAAGGILLYRVFHAGVPFLLGALGLADMGRQRHEDVLEDAARRRRRCSRRPRPRRQPLDRSAPGPAAPRRRSRDSLRRRGRPLRGLTRSAWPSVSSRPRRGAATVGRRRSAPRPRLGQPGHHRDPGEGDADRADRDQPPALQATEPAAEPIAPPVKFEVT